MPERDKPLFIREGDDWVLNGKRVEISSRDLVDRVPDLIGFACSERDWFQEGGVADLPAAYGKFRDHVQESHIPGRYKPAVEVRLERVYREDSGSGFKRR